MKIIGTIIADPAAKRWEKSKGSCSHAMKPLIQPDNVVIVLSTKAITFGIKPVTNAIKADSETPVTEQKTIRLRVVRNGCLNKIITPYSRFATTIDTINSISVYTNDSRY